MLKHIAVTSSFLLFTLYPGTTPTKPAPDAPAYTTDGSLVPPSDYHEWIFLTSGIDMSYDAPKPGAPPPPHSTFNNIFVNPSSYRSFLATGKWPDQTTIVLEIRGAENPVSINKRGHTQSTDVHAVELHVKDKGKWSFYDLSGDTKAAKLIPPPADCYTCHEAHAAVDTTFVQFYPTLLPIAQQKNTLSPVYLKEIAEPPTPTKPTTTAPTYPTK